MPRPYKERSMSKKKYETVAHEKANELLAEIAGAKAELSQVEKSMEQCFEGVRLAFKKEFDEANERSEKAEKELIKLAKKNHSDLFGTGDDERTDLPAGALLFKRFLRVRKAQSITTKLLEEKGYKEAVKISKSIDWDVVKKWSDVKLREIGTERNPVKTYEYELSTKGTKEDTKGQEKT